MIYEFREYEPMPGKLAALNERFANHTVALFKKHGIGVEGFWIEETGHAGRLLYMLSFPNLAEKERMWTSFQGDAEWQRVRTESEADGPLVARIQNRLMRPTAYSAMQ